jgi:clan AA aspartic protease (TIGR02281 family)
VRFANTTEAKCGQNQELLPELYVAQLRSADFAGAEATADKIIEKYPADPDAYGWRAETREQRDNMEGAYADMRTALSLFLDPADVALQVYYDVGRLAVKTGHPCEAVATLRDFIAFSPERRRTQQLATVMSDWQRQGSCAPLLGTGTAFLRFNPNSTAIIVSAIVNGVPGRLIVDTGASRTALSQEFARRAGIERWGQQEVHTANGKIWLPGGRAELIQVGGASLANVPIFIQIAAGGSFGDNVDGLLGLSFLGNFHMKIGGGSFELRPLE